MLLQLFAKMYQAGGGATLSTTTMGGKMMMKYEAEVAQMDSDEVQRVV